MTHTHLLFSPILHFLHKNTLLKHIRSSLHRHICRRNLRRRRKNSTENSPISSSVPPLHTPSQLYNTHTIPIHTQKTTLTPPRFSIQSSHTNNKEKTYTKSSVKPHHISSTSLHHSRLTTTLNHSISSSPPLQPNNSATKTPL